LRRRRGGAERRRRGFEAATHHRRGAGASLRTHRDQRAGARGHEADGQAGGLTGFGGAARVAGGDGGRIRSACECAGARRLLHGRSSRHGRRRRRSQGDTQGNCRDRGSRERSRTSMQDRVGEHRGLTTSNGGRQPAPNASHGAYDSHLERLPSRSGRQSAVRRSGRRRASRRPAPTSVARPAHKRCEPRRLAGLA
jgi:hypothetical protein